MQVCRVLGFAVMKICPKCNGQFEEGIAYCPKDGSRLTTLSKLTHSGGTVPDRVKGAAGSPTGPEVSADPGPDLVGRTIAQRYEVLRRLGEGGMGVVYAAVDNRLEKQVAIKVLREDFARRSDVVARFTQEAKSAARIKHENVLDVTDYGQTEDGSFYIAMELLVGTDLADVLQKEHTVDPTRALTVAVQICRALGSAHAKGIVHRDLKPENVFLVTADDGREVVKIVDFGIAQMKDLSGAAPDSSRKLTRTGMIFGTPEYMSPEQAAGKAIDQRVDIYATGVILYEMLAGRVPFVGDTFMGVLTQHMFEPVPPITQFNPQSKATTEIEAVISKSLAKDPTQRYQSMQELIDDLVAIRDGRTPGAAGFVGSVPQPGVRPQFDSGGSIASATVDRAGDGGDAKSRRTLTIVAVVGLLAVLGAGIGVFLMKNGGSRGDATNTARSGGGAGTNGASGNGTGAGGGSSSGTGGTTGTTAAGGSGSGSTAGPVTALGAGNGSDAGATSGASSGSADASTGAEMVTLHVDTTPVPGRVEVEGQPNTRCDHTPCDLRVARGTEIRLRATAANKRGEQTYTPDRDGATVTIAMRPTGGGGGGGRPGNTAGGGGGRRRCAPGQTTFYNPATGLHEPCFLQN